MGKKYLAAYDMWINTEDEEVETSEDVQQVEVSTAKMLIEQKKKNEQELANPGTCGTNLVTESNRVYNTALSNLKRKDKMYHNPLLSREAYRYDSTSLRRSNNQITALLDTLVDNKKLFKTSTGYRFSREYGTFSWSDFLLGGLKTIWQGLTNKSKTKIENPGLLVQVVVTNPLSFIGSYTNILDVVKHAIDESKGKGDGVQEAALRFGTWGNDNLYKKVYVNYKKTAGQDVNTLKKYFEVYKKMISEIKDTQCAPCKMREMSTSEIKTIKLFDPTKAEREMRKAIEYYKEKAPDIAKFAEGFADYIRKEVLEYIEKNVIVD